MSNTLSAVPKALSAARPSARTALPSARSRPAARVLDVAGTCPRFFAPGPGVLASGSAGVFDDGERSWGATSWGFVDVPGAHAQGRLSQRAAGAGGGLCR